MGNGGFKVEQLGRERHVKWSRFTPPVLGWVNIMSPSYEVLRRALRLQWYPCQQLMAWVQSWEYVTWTPLKTLLQESKAPTLSKPSSRWKADKEEKLFQIESVLTGKTAKYMFSGIGSRIKEERERGRDLAKVGCGLWISCIVPVLIVYLETCGLLLDVSLFLWNTHWRIWGCWDIICATGSPNISKTD